MTSPGKRTALHIAKIVFGAAVIIAVLYALVQQWDALQKAAAAAHPQWGYIILSAVVVLATYALLIEAWRSVVAGWSEKGGGHLDFWEGARIWSISNLGRYVPGKVWQIGTMAMMAQARGISGVAAAGSAVLVTLINTVAGFVVLAGTGASVLHIPPIGTIAIIVIGVALLATPQLLPWLGKVAERITGRNITVGTLPHRVIWFAALISAISWVTYGIAFRLLTIGVLGSENTTGALGVSIAVFTGSYLAGFLALIVPGGVGVREVVMATALKQAGFSAGEAILLVVASRIWLTILEIVPALLFLAYRWVRPRRSDGSSIEISSR